MGCRSLLRSWIKPLRTRHTLLTLTLTLSLAAPAAAQDMPSEVLVTPAGLAWIAAEAQLLGSYAGPRPPDLEARLRALRLQVIAQCQNELQRSGTCPESVPLTLLRPLVSSLSEGHTKIVDEDEAANYGLSLVGIQEGTRTVVRIADARRALPQVGTVLLRGDEVLALNGVAVRDAQAAFHGTSGPVTLTVRRDGRVWEVPVLPRPDSAPVPTPRVRWERDLPVMTYPSFTAGVQEFARLLGEVMNRDARGLVIDLRENRGGLAEQCLLAASLIAGEVGVVMRAPGAADQRLSSVRGELRQPYLTGGGWNALRVLPDLMYPGRVALLVNARSASCAEVFTTLSRQAGKRVRV